MEYGSDAPTFAIAARLGRRWRECIWPGPTFRLSARTLCRSPAGDPCSRRLRGGRAKEVAPHLREEIGAELTFLQAHWPKNLPAGVIDADLFNDNVFFLGENL